MVFKYLVRTVNDKQYITGFSLKSVKGIPTGLYEFTEEFKQPLLSKEYNKLQWTIRENPDYDPETDHIDNRYIVEYDPIQPTAEELEAEKQMAIKQKLTAELSDLILQNKDTPEALAQALCERAKQIEVEVKDEPRRDTEVI